MCHAYELALALERQEEVLRELRFLPWKHREARVCAGTANVRPIQLVGHLADALALEDGVRADALPRLHLHLLLSLHI